MRAQGKTHIHSHLRVFHVLCTCCITGNVRNSVTGAADEWGKHTHITLVSSMCEHVVHVRALAALP